MRLRAVRWIGWLPILGVLGTLPVQGQAPTGSIVGRTLDASTLRPISEVTVAIQGGAGSAITDSRGSFRLDDVAVGRYALLISMLGYQSFTVRDVVVRSDRVLRVDVQLTPEPFQLEGLSVQASQGSTLDPPASSVQRMSFEEVRRAPGAVGDPLRVVQALSGVVATDDQRNDLVVRGGAPFENLTVVDNVEVPNLNHFTSQNTSGGPISMLNTEFIRDVRFHPGGQSARFPDRLSSVLEIALREGDTDRTQYDLEMGIAGFGASAEGPVGSNGSFLLQLRRSYLELVSGSLGLSTVPEYWNLNGKLALDFGPSDRFWLLVLGGLDNVVFEPDADDPEDPQATDVVAEGQQSVLGANWQRLVGDRGVLTVGISDAVYTDETRVNDPRLSDAVTFRESSRNGVTTVKSDLAMSPNASTTIRLGASTRILRASYGVEQPIGVESPFSSAPSRVNPVHVDTSFTTAQSGLYAEAERRWARVDARAGVRINRFGFIDATRASPNAQVSVRLSPRLAVGAAVAVRHQSPELIFLTADPVNRALAPIRVRQWSAEARYDRSDRLSVSVAAYHKRYSDVPVSVEYPELSLANTGDDYTVSGLLFPMRSVGVGRARGIELNARRPLVDNWYGQLAYTWSRSEHAALDGVLRRAAFDIPHAFSGFGGVVLGDWELSGKVTYQTGRPRTPFLLPHSVEQNREVFDLSRLNAERGPDYARLDLRVDRRMNFESWSMVVFADVLNVLNRQNVSRFIWNQRTGAPDVLEQYALVPNIGFNIKF